MRRFFVLLTAMMTLLLVDAAPLRAHGDSGLLALQATPSGQPLAVKVRARLVYANDREPVSTASVTVEAVGPNRATISLGALASEGDGVYSAVLVLPVAGTWTLRAKSLEPEANSEISYRAVAPPTTTVAPTTTTTATTTTTTPSVPDAQAAGPVSADTQDDGGGGAGWLVAAGLAVLVAAVGGALLWWRSRRQTHSTG